MARRSQSVSPWKWFRHAVRRIYRSIAAPFKWIHHKIEEPLARIFPGWRLDVAMSILMAVVSLVLNAVFLGVAVSRNKPGGNALGVLYENTCENINWWNQISHALINIASTLLVQQSNSCMQKLSAPTREEIDRAHARHQWVDIGIQSFRNVWQRNIDPWRVTLWWLLAISSTILHLLWNSIIISSPTAFEYTQLSVTKDFIATPWNNTWALPVLQWAQTTDALYPDNLKIVQAGINNTAIWETLDRDTCIREYARSFTQRRSDVITVIDSIWSPTMVVGAAAGGWDSWPYSWLCNGDTGFACASDILEAGVWNLEYNNAQYPVSYCLSKIVTTPCTLDYAYIITVLVIVSNVVKLLCFMGTYWLMAFTERIAAEDGQIGDPIILTPGDAVASFLMREDPTTEGICLSEKKHFEKGLWDIEWVDIRPMRWRERTSAAWFRAVGLWSWAAFLALLLAIPIACGFFLISQLKRYHALNLTAHDIWDLGLGTPLGQFLFGSWAGDNWQHEGAIVRDVFFANFPQLVLSVAQFWWTSQLTSMLAAREYDKFAIPKQDETEDGLLLKEGRRLRVTRPKHDTDQKGVSLPMQYKILSVVIWTVLPWLASQAIFFAKIDVLDHWLYPTASSISQVGYSVLGMLAFMLAGFVTFLIAVGIGSRRLSNDVPLAGTCSAAISAACHPGRPGERHATGKLFWGVDETAPVRYMIINGRNVEVRRTTFTSDEVTYPKEDELYA